MKSLEQLVIRTRSGLRARASRLRVQAPPARLVLRLDDHDAPGPVPAGPADAESWYDAIVGVLEWSGALPVTIVAHANHPLLPELVRFCHRLECPVLLRTDAIGLDGPRAEELVDVGVAAVHVRAGEPGPTQTAITALVAARRSRRATLGVELEIPADARLRAAFAEARASGADGVRLAAPFRGGPFDAQALAWAEQQVPPFNRTPPEVYAVLRAMSGTGPGCERVDGRCPVGALRVEMLPDRTLRCCPFKEGQPRLADPASESWAALKPHRDAIRACDRRCAHPDLLR